MTKDQERAWSGAERGQLTQRKRLLEETRAEAVVLLRQAKADVLLALSGQPSDYQQWRLSELNQQIDQALAGFGEKAAQTLSTAAGKAWDGGTAAIDAPLQAVGLSVPAANVDRGQLMAMRAFMVERIKDVSSEAASKIKQQLGLTLIGSQSIQDSIEAVGRIVDGGQARATTIVRTELSRAWAVASHERALEAGRDGVPMDKVWRRSGKLYPRQGHLLADGRRVPVNEAFVINGHKLRFPHDPKAPASETINCGCVCLYRPRDIEGTLPDHKPFTEEEKARNPDMAQLADGLSIRQLQDKALRQALASRAREIATADIEHLSVYAADGRLLFSKAGDAESVRVTAGELAQLNDAVMLHNHPAGPLAFSEDDVRLAVWHDLAETHVVDRLFDYKIVRPESANWGPAYWAKTLRPIVEREAAAVDEKLAAAVRDGLIDEEQKEGIRDHLLWEEVNAVANIGYSRKPREK